MTNSPTSYAALALGFVLAGASLSGCALPRQFGERPVAAERGDAERGDASYYAHDFHGRKTASGEHFDMHELTAAHRTLPMGTRVRVTNLDNGRDVVVRINDRGPFKRGRVIDVSYEAAKTLDMVASGVAPVKVEVLR
jgi:rare lipoprotein A